MLAHLALALLASAPPNPAPAYRPAVFSAPHHLTLPYRLHVPDLPASGARLPLVVWLHDILGVGSDNLHQISGSNGWAAALFVSPATRRRYPCFVLAPQCPRGLLWFNPITRGPSRALQSVLPLIAQLEARYPIDTTRIYLAGQSMGGYAVWSLLESHPGDFAAAIVAAGAGRPSKAASFASTPVWIFHGAWDMLVPVFEARRMNHALTEAGGHPLYTEFPFLGHGNACWRRVFSQEFFLIPWLFAQSRTPARAAAPPPPSGAN